MLALCITLMPLPCSDSSHILLLGFGPIVKEYYLLDFLRIEVSREKWVSDF